MKEPDLTSEKYYLRLFGTPAISQRDSLDLQFTTRRSIQLLAILAIQPDHKFSRTELGRTLWPDDFDDANRIKFRQELLRLTAALGPAQSIILREKTHVSLLSANCDSDISELKILCDQIANEEHPEPIHRKIIELTEGEFLAGRQDLWIDRQRQKFETIRNRSLQAVYPRLDARLEGAYPSPVEMFGFAEDRNLSSPDFPKSDRHRAKFSEPELVNPVFFGRDRELEKLEAMILGSEPKVRLITVIGPGGIGKTRIAQEIANLSRRWFSGRSWFVSLAELKQHQFILPEVMNSLGLNLESSETIISTIKKGLNPDSGPALIVLDNLEQFPDCGAKSISELLKEIPSLTIVATSRRPVLIAQEQQLHLRPLDTTASYSSAAKMFVELARKTDLDLEFSNQDLAKVKELVTLLEGVPLAIALAASRLGMTALDELTASIHDKIFSLGSRHRDVSERHQSPKACIEWSYDLLPERLQKPFCHLSVFSGGWFEEHAAQVTGYDDIRELMDELEGSSLIYSVASASRKHYRMLECIREYAEEKLTIEEIDQLRKAHFETYNNFCEELSNQVTGREQQLWLSRAEAEADNMREALLWSVDFQPDRSVPFLTDQITYWWGSSRYSESIKLLDHVLKKCPKTEEIEWGRLWWSIGSIFAARGEFSRGEEVLLSGIEIFERAKYPNGMTSCLYNLAELYRLKGELEKTIQTCYENLAWVNPDNVRDVTYPNCTLSECLVRLGLVRKGKRILTNLAANLPAHLEPVCKTFAVFGLVVAAIETCDFKLAEEMIEESERLISIIGSPLVHGDFEFTHARLHHRVGRRSEAIECLESAINLYDRIGQRPNLAEAKILKAQLIYSDHPDEALNLLQSSFSLSQSLPIRGGCLRCCRTALMLFADEIPREKAIEILNHLDRLGVTEDNLPTPSEQRSMSIVRSKIGWQPPDVDSAETFKQFSVKSEEIFLQCLEHRSCLL